MVPFLWQEHLNLFPNHYTKQLKYTETYECDFKFFFKKSFHMWFQAFNWGVKMTLFTLVGCGNWWRRHEGWKTGHVCPMGRTSYLIPWRSAEWVDFSMPLKILFPNQIMTILQYCEVELWTSTFVFPVSWDFFDPYWAGHLSTIANICR